MALRVIDDRSCSPLHRRASSPIKSVAQSVYMVFNGTDEALMTKEVGEFHCSW